jgi:hypothetical protein
MLKRAFLGVVMSVFTIHAADLPELKWTPKAAMGLSVPSGGDGANVPASVDGIAVQRIAPGSLYFYVRVADERYEKAAPLDLYAMVEVADDEFNRVKVQYDQFLAGNRAGHNYANAEGAEILTGQGGWRTLCFLLPQARVGHGENHGTDFRLCARGLAVRSIRVSAAKPAGFQLDQGLSAETIRSLRVQRASGMELTVGNDANETDARIFRELSVTSVESYVHWTTVEAEARDRWDWSRWDSQVDVLQRNGLKWVPFLIAGPAYATPLWFQESSDSHVFRCLEHDTDTKVQSIFNPALKPMVDRFLKAFAERYRDRGVVESVLLGVTGIYGESIYPAGPEGGWTAQLTGPYHNHAGWWAGDTLARQAFRKAMQARYNDIAALNKGWGTEYAGFSAVSTFLPNQAPSDRARADFVEWYQQAMTDWAVFWVATTRKYMPDTEIYLCTGGSGAPVLGADFTAQAKAIAPYGAGIRITNEASGYAHNFVITREVATATHLYGTFAGFEPAGKVDEKGVVARIYNATASGIRQLHYYQPNFLQSKDALANFRREIARLVPRQPQVTVGFYVSRESWAVAPEVGSSMYGQARALRDLTDFAMVTRQSVADGALGGLRALVLLQSPVLEPAVAQAIEQWVRGGGVLIAADMAAAKLGSRLYDGAAWRQRLLAPVAATDALVRVALNGPAPDRWRLLVGTEADGPWLTGDWFHRERGMEWPDVEGARKRWSGPEPRILLPTRPGADYMLRLDAHLADHSVAAGANEVSVNGAVVGRLDRAGNHSYEFTVPKRALTRSPAVLAIHMKTWSPKKVGQSGDDRELGVALRIVELVRQGARGTAFGTAALQYELDPEAFRAHVRQVGQGWTVYLPGLSTDTERLPMVLAPVLRDTGRYLVGAAPLAAQDGKADGVYSTLTASGVLRYDGKRATVSETPKR